MQGGVPLGSGGRCLLCGLFGLVPVMGIVGPFQQLFRCAASLRGIVLFSLPAGNVLDLAGGLIFQCEAVGVMACVTLGLAFSSFNGSSPPILDIRKAPLVQRRFQSSFRNSALDEWGLASQMIQHHQVCTI